MITNRIAWKELKIVLLKTAYAYHELDNEHFFALDELSAILQLGSIYPFQTEDY